MRTRALVTTAAAVVGLALGAGAGVAVAGQRADDERRAGRDSMHEQMQEGWDGMAGMAGDMAAMHDAIGAEAMDEMHADMVARLPEDLRDDAAEMHAQMGEHLELMGGMEGMGGMAGDHASHHGAGR